jgi:endonuclease/exonuclease/phosphatase family metal-dependent hydrolase
MKISLHLYCFKQLRSMIDGKNILKIIVATLLYILTLNALSGCFSSSFLFTPEGQKQFILARQAEQPLFTQPITLKVLTFNVWGLPFTPDRSTRLRAIAQKIADIDPDLVCLQECWIEADRQLLNTQLAATRLKYVEYYPSGAFGSGLMILSAYPITNKFFWRYTQNGKWYKLWHGDWWGGKGVALAQVQFPKQHGVLNIFNTHLIAAYQDDRYDDDRLSQMQELASVLKTATDGRYPALILGDLNCGPGTSEYERLRANANVVRLMTLVDPTDQILGLPTPSYRYETLNTISIAANIPHDGKQIPLSDHNGYLSVIKILPANYFIAEPEPAQNSIDRINN